MLFANLDVLVQKKDADGWQHPFWGEHVMIDTSTKTGTETNRDDDKADAYPSLKQVLFVQRLVEFCRSQRPKNKQDGEEKLTAFVESQKIIDIDLPNLDRNLKRFDKKCRTNLRDTVLGVWANPPSPNTNKPQKADQESLLQEYEKKLQIRLNAPKLRHVLSIVDHLGHLLDQDPEPTIVIGTTEWLLSRFWPRVIPQFNKFFGSEGFKKCHLRFETFEPYELREMLIHRRNGLVDLVVTYGNKQTIENLKPLSFTALHRCLVGTPREIDRLTQKLPAEHRREPEFSLDLLKNERVAILHDAERSMPEFPWEELFLCGAIVERRKSSLSTIAQARFGAAFTVVFWELINELGQITLKAIDIRSDQKFGDPVLALFDCSPEQKLKVAKDDSGAEKDDPEDPFQYLATLVTREFRKMNDRYAKSQMITGMLRAMDNSYATLTRKGKVEVWRGRIDLRVTPGMCVQGDYDIFGDPRHPKEGRHRPKSSQYLVTGSIDLPEGDLRGNMILKSVAKVDLDNKNTDNRSEIESTAFFILDRGEDVKSPDMDVLIGHWTGRDHNNQPRSGLWFFHKQKNLPETEIKIIFSGFLKKHRERLGFDWEIEAVYGTVEPGQNLCEIDPKAPHDLSSSTTKPSTHLQSSKAIMVKTPSKQNAVGGHRTRPLTPKKRNSKQTRRPRRRQK